MFFNFEIHIQYGLYIQVLILSHLTINRYKYISTPLKQNWWFWFQNECSRILSKQNVQFFSCYLLFNGKIHRHSACPFRYSTRGKKEKCKIHPRTAQHVFVFMKMNKYDFQSMKKACKSKLYISTHCHHLK